MLLKEVLVHLTLTLPFECTYKGPHSGDREYAPNHDASSSEFNRLPDTLWKKSLPYSTSYISVIILAKHNIFTLVAEMDF